MSKDEEVDRAVIIYGITKCLSRLSTAGVFAAYIRTDDLAMLSLCELTDLRDKLSVLYHEKFR